MTDEEKNKEQCEPCLILAAAGLIIGQYCSPSKADCNELASKVEHGEITLRELGEMLEAEEEFLGVLVEEGVDLDAVLVPMEEEIETTEESKKEGGEE